MVIEVGRWFRITIEKNTATPEARQAVEEVVDEVAESLATSLGELLRQALEYISRHEDGGSIELDREVDIGISDSWKATLIGRSYRGGLVEARSLRSNAVATGPHAALRGALKNAGVLS